MTRENGPDNGVLGRSTMESVAAALDDIFNNTAGEQEIDFVVVAFEHQVGPRGCAIIGNYGDRDMLLTTFRVLISRIEHGADMRGHE